MIYKSIILFVLAGLINNSNAKEFRQFTYINADCNELPTATYASTACSPESYFELLNESFIHSFGIESKDECVSIGNDDNGDVIKIGTCLSEDGEIVYENSQSGGGGGSYSDSYSSSPYSWSMKMEVSDRNPVLINDNEFCNHIKMFDCDNYLIYSFKNNSCFTNSDESNINSYPFTKQSCVNNGNTIQTFICKDYCGDEEGNCILEKTENSNLGVCPNIKSSSIQSLIDENNLKSNKKVITKQDIVEEIPDKDLPKTDIDTAAADQKNTNNSNTLLKFNISFLILILSIILLN